MFNEKICAISGTLPYKLPRGLSIPILERRLDDEIRRSIYLGNSVFLTGMSMGADILAAEIVLRLKDTFPCTRLFCCLPYETQAARWPVHWRERYFNILAAADNVVFLQTHYTSGCLQRCRRGMIGESSRLIAVHDCKSGGSAELAVRYAKKRGLDVVVINPLDCLCVSP